MTLCEKCIHIEVCAIRDCHDEADEKALTFCADHKPQSRFVELPCEVGQTVYTDFEGKIYEGKICSFSLQDDGTLWVYIRYGGGLNYWHMVEDFGKTVFLSREEAEKALSEGSK